MTQDLFYFLVTYGTHPLVIASLAAAAMLLKWVDRHSEKVAPRLVIALIYVSIFVHPLMEEIVRRYLVRWGLWLLLVVEIISWFVRKNSHLFTAREKRNER